MTEQLLYALFAAAFGLLIGSFLNVCISRLPDDYSVAAPRSQCPRCGATIAWYDNVPLLSFVVLGGRGRCCGSPISIRYPVVEFFTGAAFFHIVWRLGPGWPAIKWCTFAAILFELIFSDAETRILPDEFTKWGTALGLMFAPIVPLPYGLLGFTATAIRPNSTPAFESFFNAAIAAASLSGGLWLMGVAYQRLRGREGLGFGDVKMVAFLGSFLGLETALLGLMFGSILGSVLGIIWIKLRREDVSKYELPFGSFLGVGALMAAVTLI